MPNDFNRVFAENESQPFPLTDIQYSGGWESIVNQEAPKKQQFNAIHKELDSKARESYFRARSVYQADFTYEINDLVFGVDGVLYKANVSVIGVPPTSTASQWDATPVGGSGSSGGGLEAGMIIETGSQIVPAGFLLCDGSVVTQAAYPNLFSSIGGGYNDTFPATPGGVPVGSFRLPYLFDIYRVGSSGLPGQYLAQNAGDHTHAVPKNQATNAPNVYSFNTSASGGGYGFVPGNFVQQASDVHPTGGLVTTDVPFGSTSSLIRPNSTTVRCLIKT